MNSNHIVLGVDIGGSHITAAMVNLYSKQIMPPSRVRVPVDSTGTATEIMKGWTSVLKQSLFNKKSVRRIGIAIPGPFDYIKGILLIKEQSKFKKLYGINIKQFLARDLDLDPENICFVNDAEGFLRGELFSRETSQLKSAIGLTLGTGLGSAKFADGEVKDADLWCSAFLNGIAEDYLSTRWFIQKYASLTGKILQDVKQLIAEPGNEKHIVFNEFGKNLALFLNDFILKERPELVILGGNISNAFHLFNEEFQKHLADFPFEVKIKPSCLGEDACLIGAASSWKSQEKLHLI